VHSFLNPAGNLKRYQETISYINRQEVIDSFKTCGIFTIERQEIDEAIEPKIQALAKHFKFEKTSS
jgi:hypothetical protein